MPYALRAALLAAFVTLPSYALADDWHAAKLRGTVLELVGGQWKPLQRGDVVPDGNAIKTLADGHADFVRGEETVSLAPNTQIVIADKARAGQKPFTTVQQSYGTISVEAQVEQVQHFAVQTPYLAAVVKGTRFTVTSGQTGASVSVQRGHVAVEDQHDHSHVTLSVAQAAKIDKVSTRGAIEVTGKGKLPPVLSATGKPLPPKPPAPLKGPKAGPTPPGLLKKIDPPTGASGPANPPDPVAPGNTPKPGGPKSDHPPKPPKPDKPKKP